MEGNNFTLDFSEVLGWLATAKRYSEEAEKTTDSCSPDTIAHVKSTLALAATVHGYVLLLLALESYRATEAPESQPLEHKFNFLEGGI